MSTANAIGNKLSKITYGLFLYTVDQIRFVYDVEEKEQDYTLYETFEDYISAKTESAKKTSSPTKKATKDKKSKEDENTDSKPKEETPKETAKDDSSEKKKEHKLKKLLTVSTNLKYKLYFLFDIFEHEISWIINHLNLEKKPLTIKHIEEYSRDGTDYSVLNWVANTNLEDVVSYNGENNEYITCIGELLCEKTSTKLSTDLQEWLADKFLVLLKTIIHMGARHVCNNIKKNKFNNDMFLVILQTINHCNGGTLYSNDHYDKLKKTDKLPAAPKKDATKTPKAKAADKPKTDNKVLEDSLLPS